MVKGNVKWFNDNRGYGLIGRSEGADVHVHFSAIRGEGFRTLESGQMVLFHMADTTRDPSATTVVSPGSESDESLFHE
jgi:CspA family cold shock protein